MGDLEIRGGREARQIARAFERAAARDLRYELQRGLEEGAESMVDAAHVSALRNLPKRGRLNLLVAAARIIVLRSGGRDPSVKIVATGMDQLYPIDKLGVVEHPTFAHRPRVRQSIPKAEGWFTEACEHEAPKVRRELERAIDRVARRIASAARG